MESTSDLLNCAKELMIFDLNESDEMEVFSQKLTDERICLSKGAIPFFKYETGNIFDKAILNSKLDDFFPAFRRLENPYIEVLSLKEGLIVVKAFVNYFRLLSVIQNVRNQDDSYENQEILDKVFDILVLLTNNCRKLFVLVRELIKNLPKIFHNLGGAIENVFSNFESKKKCSTKMENPNPEILINIKYILQITHYVLHKYQSEKEPQIGSKDIETIFTQIGQIDEIIMLLFALSNDELIIKSNVITVIRKLISTVLKLYPAEINYGDKIQDLVEKFGIYWDDNEFNLSVASHIVSSIFPFCERGLLLRSSLAFYALLCCLTPDEVAIADRVELSLLSKTIRKNCSVLQTMTHHQLYKIIFIVDAVITPTSMMAKFKPEERATEPTESNLKPKRGRKAELERIFTVLENAGNLSRKRTDRMELDNADSLFLLLGELKSEWLGSYDKDGKRQLTLENCFARSRSIGSISSQGSQKSFAGSQSP